MNTALVAPDKLPINYLDVVKAIAVCANVDECLEFRDKAAAIAAYAYMKRDNTLFEKAERIKIRSTRRFGELTNEIIKTTRKPVGKICRSLGVTAAEARTARNVAKVGHREFERRVEASPPATISRLAKMGSNPRGSDESGPVWRVTERLRALTREFPVTDLEVSIAGCTDKQLDALRQALRPVYEWADTLAAKLKI